MGLKIWLTTILASPVVTSLIFSYLGYTTTSKVIYRTEVFIVTPFISAAIVGYLGYQWARKLAANAKSRPDGPCLDVIQSSIMFQVPLILGSLGGIIGFAIDLFLFIKWLI